MQVTKGLKKGQLFVYARTIYDNIQIYEIDLYAVKNAVTVLAIINECDGFGTTQLYPKGIFKPKPFEKYQSLLDTKILSKMV